MTGAIKVLDHTGHTMTEWNVADPATVEQARAVFTAIMQRGYSVYAMDAPGSSGGTAVKEFDPQVREYLAHRPLVGG